jgi:ADP-heptose:LPS heptosyltransferase
MNVWVLKFLDATVGGLLCWFGGYWLHWGRRESGVSLPGVPADIRRILVIRPGGMGDMVLLLPMLKALRQHYPVAAIDLVCETRNREIPGLAGDPAELLLYDAHPLQTLVRLIRRRYDLTIDTEQFHYFSAVMTWFSGAPVRIGFKINPGRNPLYTHLINSDLTG